MEQQNEIDIQLMKRSFEELRPQDLYQILKLRSVVFVVEQVCPYLDMDDQDQTAIHLYYAVDGMPKAYVRVQAPKGYDGEHASIGRVVVHPGFRGMGWGRRIFQEGIDYCLTAYSAPIKISAQLYLQPFYTDFGFEPSSQVYLEDGIPHIEMVRTYKNERT